jgi:NitT/TauT family transport system ATP-binding protein
MVTHDLSEAFRLGTRVIAFDRPRDRPEEQERYGATLTPDIKLNGSVPNGVAKGATVTRDFDVWPPKIAAEFKNGSAPN